MGIKDSGQKTIDVGPLLCRAQTNFSGYPKHLREWWCANPTLESLVLAIRDYHLNYAPEKEHNLLRGMVKAIGLAKQVPGAIHSSRNTHLVRTPSGVLKQVKHYHWYVPRENVDYAEENTIQITQMGPCQSLKLDKITSHLNSPQPKTNGHLELF